MELSHMGLREQICDVCHKMWQFGWVTANDGNVSVRPGDGTPLAIPIGTSKSSITPGKLVRIDGKGEVLESLLGHRPFSEIKMHLHCYREREDVSSMLHAYPPVAAGYVVANVSLDEHSMIETVIVLGSIPAMPYGTPSTYKVPDNIASYLGEHDAMLPQYHGASTVGADVITAYYRMETLELSAKISFNARMLGGAREISRENIDRLISVGKGYGVTGRHPSYKKYSKQGENRC